MKHGLLLCFLLIIVGSASAAPESGLPTNVCFEENCGPQQRRIWTRFQEFSGLNHERAPGMYSGVCFHNSPSLDGDRVHYGGILIQSVNERLFFDGRFSFFNNSNPYTHLSLDSARTKFDKLLHPTHELEFSRTFAFVNLEDKFVSRRYWFRHDRLNGLVLVGYFGPLHTILCDLRRNVQEHKGKTRSSWTVQ